MISRVICFFLEHDWHMRTRASEIGFVCLRCGKERWG